MRAKTKRLILGGTGAAAAAAAALVLATAGSGAVSAGCGKATAGNAVTTAHIKSLVMTAAAGLGDSTPTDICYSALTTRNRALAAVGAGSVGPPYGQTPSYLVVAHGNFTAYGESPPGSDVNPTGTELTLVVDASNWQATDSGIGHPMPDESKAMATLGTVTKIASN